MKDLLEVIEERKEEFVESGADLEHDRWGKWQAYMHSKMVEHSNGKGEFVCLPVGLYRRWERQIATTYKDLSETEKESDREQVRPYLPLVESHTKAILTNVVERLRLEKRDQDAPKEGDPHFTGCGGCGADYPAICGCREVNHALQTQIDYLEDILEKLG